MVNGFIELFVLESIMKGYHEHILVRVYNFDGGFIEMCHVLP